MTVRGKNENDMPAVPDPDFVGTLCEIWFAINYAAYHLAYVRVYLQTEALQTHRDEIRKAEQAFREMTQAEVIVCRAHLAAFFWQVDHVFEALRIAIKKGQKEHPDLKYFWSWGKKLEEIDTLPIYKEINAYRNKSHEFPGIVGCKWEDKGAGPNFIHHFLPSIEGHEPKDNVDINEQLQKYFEFAANVWLSFARGDYKEKFPRNFKFLVTVPHSFRGELPPELKGVPQLEVSVVAQDPAAPAEAATEEKGVEVKLKIFWSWQSDTPGEIGRYLVRDALKDAIEELKQAEEIEEATRENLHLDQDIQGVTGSPDLARTIFDKIEKVLCKMPCCLEKKLPAMQTHKHCTEMPMHRHKHPPAATAIHTPEKSCFAAITCTVALKTPQPQILRDNVAPTPTPHENVIQAHLLLNAPSAAGPLLFFGGSPFIPVTVPLRV